MTMRADVVSISLFTSKPFFFLTLMSFCGVLNINSMNNKTHFWIVARSFEDYGVSYTGE